MAHDYLALLEDSSVTTDNAEALEFLVTIPARKFDLPANAILRRLFIDANTSGQTLTPTLIYVDGTTQALATFSSVGRQVKEYALALTKRWIAVQIAGSLTLQVNIYGIEIEAWVSTVIVSPWAAQEEIGK